MADDEITLTFKGASDDLVKAATAARDAIKGVKDESDESGEAEEGAAEGAGTFTAALESMGHSFVARVAEGVLLRDAIRDLVDKFKEAVLALPEVVEHSIEAGNSLYEMSLKTGASVEGLSGLQYAAGQTGVSLDTMVIAMQQMETHLFAVGAQGDVARAAIGKLGLSVTDLQSEKPDQVFIDILSAIGNLPSSGAQAAAGMSIFGRQFHEMSGLAHEDIGELVQDAEDLGLIMSTETAAAAHAAQIGFESLGAQFNTIEQNISAAFLPAVIGLTQAIGVTLKDATTGANSILNDLGGSQGALGVVARAMGTSTDATKSQAELFIILRDGVITVVRDGVEPLIAAFGAVIQIFDFFKIAATSIVMGLETMALWFEKAEQASLNMANSLHLIKASDFTALSSGVAASIKDVTGSLADQQKAIDGYKQNITDWGKTTTDLNTKIEASMAQLGNTTVDVSAIIKKFADLSRAAGAQGGTDLAAPDKAVVSFVGHLKTLVDEYQAYADKTSDAEAMIKFANQFEDAAIKADDLGVKMDHLTPSMQATVTAFKDIADQVGGLNPKQLALIASMQTLTSEFDAYASQSSQLDATKKFGQAIDDASAKALQLGVDVDTLPPALATVVGSFQDMASTVAGIQITVDMDTLTNKVKDGIGSILTELDKVPGQFGDSWGKLEKISADFDQKMVDATSTSTDKQIADIQRQEAVEIDVINKTSGLDSAAKADALASAHAYYQNQIDQANQTYDTLDQRMSKSGVLQQWQMQDNADKAKIDYQQMLDSGQYTADELYTAWKKWYDLDQQARDTMRNQWEEALGQIASAANALAGTFTGALNTIIKGIGTLTSSLQGALTSQTTLNKGFSEMGSGQSLKGITDVASGLMGIASAGVAIGNALSPLLSLSHGWLGDVLGTSTAGRSTVEAWAATFKGGFQEMHSDLDELGSAGENMWIKLTQGDRGNAAQATADIKTATDALSAMKTAQDDIASAQTSLVSGLNSSVTGFLKPLTDVMDAAEDYSSKLTTLQDQQSKLAGQISDMASKGGPTDATQAANLQIWKDNLASVTHQIDALTSSQNTAAAAAANFAATGQDSFDRLSRIALASFNTLIKGGASEVDAMNQIGPSIDQLIKAHNDLGLAGSDAYNTLARFRDLTATNADLMNSVSGLNDVMTSLNTLGGLDASTFDDLQKQGVDAFNQLTAAGFTNQEAEQQMAPLLESIIQLHKDKGYAIDDNTQKLIDQATQDGTLTANQMSLNDIMMQGFAALITAVGGTLPDAFKTLVGSVSNVSTTVSNNKTAWTDWSKTAGDAIDGVRKGVDGISFGSSPGGLKEWAPLLSRSKDAMTDFHKTAISALGEIRAGVDGVGLVGTVGSFGAASAGAYDGLQDGAGGDTYKIEIDATNAVIADQNAMTAFADKIAGSIADKVKRKKKLPVAS